MQEADAVLPDKKRFCVLDSLGTRIAEQEVGETDKMNGATLSCSPSLLLVRVCALFDYFLSVSRFL